MHDGKEILFNQDISVEDLKKCQEFNDVRKILSNPNMFRGFPYPAKLHCFHETKMHKAGGREGPFTSCFIVV